MSELGSLHVNIGLNSQGFQKGITQVNKQMKLAQAEFKNASSKLKEFGTVTDLLKVKSEYLNKTVDLQSKKVEALKEAFEKAKAEKGEDAKATQELGIKYNYAEARLNQLKGQLKQTNDTIKKQENVWNQLSKELQKTGTTMQNVGSKMQNVGKTLTAKVTAPLAAIGVASVKSGMDFESAMSEVQAISGTTGADLEAMKQKALEMGTETSKSATDSANALKYMSLAGWDSKTSIEALEPVLRLSEAGAMDLGLASDMVTDSMSALGLEVQELPQYLDMMAQTSSKSNTSVQQLGEAMVIAGGTFKNLNVPMNEANAILGILANRGIKGSEAANGLNSVMVNLTTGAGKAGKAMEELNISAFDSEGKFKGMANVLKEVRDKTKDMTEEQRNLYLSMIGGKTQLDTLQALISGVGEEYDSLKTDIENSNGALEKMATTMQDNLKGSLTKLKSALESASITISNTLIPIVEDAVEIVQNWTDKFNSLTPAQQETIVKIGMMALAIGPLIVAVGTVISSIGGAITGLSTIAGALGTTATATAGAATATTGFGTVLAAITGPIGIAIGAIAGLTAVTIAVYKNWDTLKPQLLSVWYTIQAELINVTKTIEIGFIKMAEGVWAIIEKIGSWIPQVKKYAGEARAELNSLILEKEQEKQTAVLSKQIDAREQKLQYWIAKSKKAKDDEVSFDNELLSEKKQTMAQLKSMRKTDADDIQTTSTKVMGVSNNLTKTVTSNNAKVAKSSTKTKDTVTNDFKTATDLIDKKIGLIKDKLELWKLKNGETATSIKALNETTKAQKEELVLVEEKIRLTKQALDESKVAYSENSSAVLQLESELIKLEIEQAKLNNSINGTTAQLNKATKAWKDYYKATGGGVHKSNSKNGGASYYNENTGEHTVIDSDGNKTVYNSDGTIKSQTKSNNSSSGGSTEKPKKTQEEKQASWDEKRHNGGTVGGGAGDKYIGNFIKILRSGIENDEKPLLLKNEEYVLSENDVGNIRYLMSYFKKGTRLSNSNVQVSFDDQEISNFRLKGAKGNNITQNITINSLTPLSPAETARQNKRILQELALQF
ncbi:phage tail tape measure protein [Wukongibacter sp. M2B1]|uniref:phage tail tape measure protein n=1 Tax=Wukongibacter sp. M2B1 TaxID=3088895 RepID=UPI003D78F132